MQACGKLAVGMAVVFGFFGYQFFIHKVVTAPQISPISAALVLAPFAIGAGWAIKVEMNWRWAVLIVSALALLGYLAVRYFGYGQITFGLPHLATNLFLMWFFARTLKSGREALITAIARKVHGSLKPEIESYTRTVTLAWSLFFAMQIVISLALFSFASLDAWSTYINLLNVPMIVLMFIVEYTYRVLRYREHQSSIFSAMKYFNRNTDESKSSKAQ